MKLLKTTSWTGLVTGLVIGAWLCGCTTDFDSFLAKPSADRDSAAHGPMSDAAVGDAAPIDAGMDSDAADIAAVTDAAVRDAGLDEPRDDAAVAGGTDPGSGTSCEPLERRCHDDTVEACKSGGDGWKVRTRCGAAMCNPVSLECYACEAELTSDGVLACAAAHSASSGTAIAEVDTDLAADDSAGSCGGTGSSEAVVEWIAPASDYFVLDTQGSDFDTVLYARDCSCDGVELACNNNASQSDAYSEIVAHFDKGQRVALVVDGNAGSSGHAVINANPVTCPAFDLALASLPATLIDENHDGSENMRFTPTTVVSIRSACARSRAFARACSTDRAAADRRSACNTSNDAYGAQIIRELEAGRPLTLAVTLMSGDTSLRSLDRQVARRDVRGFERVRFAAAFADGWHADRCFAQLSDAELRTCRHHESEQQQRSPGAGSALRLRYPRAGRSTDGVRGLDRQRRSRRRVLVARRLRWAEVACNLSTFNSSTNKYQAGVDIPGTGVATSYVIAIERGNVIPPRSPFKFSYIMSLLQ